MHSDRWKQVDNLLQAALERPPDERDAFLRHACAGDAALEREVRSLLRSQQQAGSFLDSPAMELAAAPWPGSKAKACRKTCQSRGMAPGTKLGSYEIVAALGAGGMGEVYRARDTRLERSVAIKILPAEFSADSERLRRFEREARLASALNHPNIVTIYELGQDGSTHYIAMELIEGKTLRELLAAGSLPIRKSIEIAAQVAEGLAKAHEAGIAHRDLKPGNLMVTRRWIRQNPGLWPGEARPAERRAVGYAQPVRVATRNRVTSWERCNTCRRSRPAAASWISGRTSSRSAWCSTKW